MSININSSVMIHDILLKMPTFRVILSIKKMVILVARKVGGKLFSGIFCFYILDNRIDGCTNTVYSSRDIL